MIKVYILDREDVSKAKVDICASVVLAIQEISKDFEIPYEIEEVSRDTKSFKKMQDKLNYTCVEKCIRHPIELCQRKCGNGILFGLPTIIYNGRAYVGIETPKALRQDIEDERSGKNFKPRTMWRTKGVI